MEKMKCKVILLPHNEGELQLGSDILWNIPGQFRGTSFHLYFLSDEEIQVGDLYIYPDLVGNDVWINKEAVLDKSEYVGAMKVVASTDTSLDLPLIPQDFIQEYVESNGKIEEVEIELKVTADDFISGTEEDGRGTIWKTDVIVSKIKEFYPRNEVERLCAKCVKDGLVNFNKPGSFDIDKWFQQNL
jgi:hypothetical protein